MCSCENARRGECSRRTQTELTRQLQSPSACRPEVLHSYRRTPRLASLIWAFTDWSGEERTGMLSPFRHDTSRVEQDTPIFLRYLLVSLETTAHMEMMSTWCTQSSVSRRSCTMCPRQIRERENWVKSRGRSDDTLEVYIFTGQMERGFAKLEHSLRSW